MTALDDLPYVSSFFGVDLKTGSMIIAALGVVHPMAYGCSFFVPLSYLLVTIWILVALFFAASILLFCGVAKGDAILCAIWIWYTVIFVVVMLMMMMLLAIVFTSRKQRNRVFIVILGMLWYICAYNMGKLKFLKTLEKHLELASGTALFLNKRVDLALLNIIVTIYFILVVNSHRKQLLVTNLNILVNNLMDKES